MTEAPAVDRIVAQFDQAWRDETPIFGCCRKAVKVALRGADPRALVDLDPAARVRALHAAVEAELPGHLDGHRCCRGHLADLAFDLPDLFEAERVDA